MKITFTDKTSIDNRPDLSDVEKMTGENINEIKNVVNENADELDATKVKVENINTLLENFNKEVEALKENDTKQYEKVEYLEKEAVRLRQDIEASQLIREETGENITLNDASDARFNKFGIGGNHKQETREGYNLLDFNVTQDGRVTVNKDGTITINGTGGFSIKFKEVEYKKGVTYKAKATLVSGTYTSSDPNHIGIMTPHEDYDWLANNIFKTYTFLKDKVRSGIWVGEACVFNNATFEIYCYEGTDDKNFEQYGASPSPDFPSEIKTVGGNINIFNKNDVMKNAYLNSANGSTLSSSTSVTSNYIEINSNSNYVINGYGTNNYYKVVCYYDKNKNFISSIIRTDTKNELKISAPHGACYLRFHISKNSEEVKLEKGSIITSYSQYNQGSVEIDVVNNDNTKSQSVIMPIQQEMLTGDYVTDVEHHEWRKVVLDGTENWNLQSINSYGLANFNYQTGQSEVEVKFNVLSNYFKAQTTSIAQTTNEGIFMQWSNEFFIRVKSNRASTIDEFKTFLKSKYDEGDPVIVYYKLAEPIDLELTSEQKVVAKQIKETLHTYKNVTHIYSDDEISPIVNVEYAKDLNTTISNIQALVLNNASEEVSG